MTEDGAEGDDPILARLRESAAGDPAVRQLRRRYDMLRGDYEQLLDRLGELEDRLNAQALAARTGETAPSPERPMSKELHDVLLAPLLKLRDDYVTAATRITALVSGLETLAQGSFKGQHSVPEEPERPPPLDANAAPAAGDLEETENRSAVRSKRLHVDVRGQGFGELLDFQERLSSLDGVARVSINAIDTERATLVVELEPGPTAATADDED
ncbi:MAG: hypothetical protein ABI782_02855 [Anaerolineaceae bacterium]